MRPTPLRAFHVALTTGSHLGASHWLGRLNRWAGQERLSATAGTARETTEPGRGLAAMLLAPSLYCCVVLDELLGLH
jgi:hypothetical protein